MSNLFSKILTWFVLLVVLIAIITSVRTELMVGGAAYDVFVALFNDFPFAEQMAEIVSNICQYNITLHGLSSGNVISDLTKLFGMTLICPLVVGFATMILLPVPEAAHWSEREDYMSRPGYRIKEALVHVVTMPICAWATAKLLEYFQKWLEGEFSVLNPTVISFALLILFVVASTLFLWVRSGFSFGGVFRYRMIDCLLGNLLKIVGLNLCCFVIALGIINDQGGVVMWTILLLFIYMAGISMMLDGLRGIFS